MIDQPDIRPAVGVYPYVVATRYTYEWTAEGVSWRIHIGKGFPLDGISTPRWTWFITGITPDGLGRAAALVHDYLYRYDGQLPDGSFQRLDAGEWVNVSTPWTRQQADKLFANILDLSGVGRWERRMMYRAVRLFGWFHWNDL